MDNLEQLKVNIELAHKILQDLNQKIGAYSDFNAYYNDKITLQCEDELLENWLKVNHLHYNSKFNGIHDAYETDNFILFTDRKYREEIKQNGNI